MSDQQILAGRLGIDSHGDSWLLETGRETVLVDVADFNLLNHDDLIERRLVSILGRFGVPTLFHHHQTHRPAAGRPRESPAPRVRDLDARQWRFAARPLAASRKGVARRLRLWAGAFKTPRHRGV